MVICKCDGTPEGILTAVFDAWEIDIKTSEISVTPNDNMVLFGEYHEVVTDFSKAERVRRTVIRRISSYAYEMVFFACCSTDPDRGNAVLQFIRRGIKIGADVVNDLKNHYVMKVFELYRNVKRELMHFRGFIRFRQQGKYLMAKYNPNNDILIPMADFFSDRFMRENFMIVDMNRNKAAVHYSCRDHFITSVDREIIEHLKIEDSETEIIELWETFEKTIAIEARHNPKLQQQNMPLRFRDYMDLRK